MFWPLTLIGKSQNLPLKQQAEVDVYWSQREQYRLRKVIEEAQMALSMHENREHRLSNFIAESPNK